MENTINVGTGFEYINLTEVNPNGPTIPNNFYTLKLLNAALMPHTYGVNSKKAGQTGTKTVLKFAIADGEFAGRRVTKTVWDSPFAPVELRRLMDAVQIPQTGTFVEWLAQLTEIQPKLTTFVASNEAGIAEVDLRQARPSQD